MSKTNNKMTFINSKSGNPRELNEIDIFFDAILNSKDTYIEDYNNGMRLTYKRVRDINNWLPELISMAKSIENENDIPNNHI